MPYNENYMKNFKDGISDALLKGVMSNDYGQGYKQGYDFGVVMYCEQIEMEESRKIMESRFRRIYNA